MALFDDYRHGNSGIHLEARRFVPQGTAQGRIQAPVLVRLRVIRFRGPAGDFSCHREVAFLGFHPGQLRIPHALPSIVSSVADRLDEQLRRHCKSRLLRLACRAAAGMTTASTLKLLVDVVVLDVPGCSANEVVFMHERMRMGGLRVEEEEEEKAAVVRNYYFLEGVGVDDGREGRGGYGDTRAGKLFVRRPTVPASKLFIIRLESTPYRQEGNGREGFCVICMEEFRAGTEVSKTPCSHTFHRSCIKRWLKRSHLCPACRYQMPTFDCWMELTCFLLILYCFISLLQQ